MRRPFNRPSSSSPSPFHRTPKPRPAGFIPPKLSQIKAKPPASGKQRRRQLKASAWRLSQMVHAPAAKIIEQIKTDRAQIILLANRNPDRRGDAVRLGNKIARLVRRPAST